MLKCRGCQWDFEKLLNMGTWYVFSRLVAHVEKALLITEKGISYRLERDYISHYFTLESLLPMLKKTKTIIVKSLPLVTHEILLVNGNLLSLGAWFTNSNGVVPAGLMGTETNSCVATSVMSYRDKKMCQ